MSHEQDSTPIPMGDEKEQVPTPNMDDSNVGGSQDISMNIENSTIPNESQRSMPNEMEANRRKQTSDVWNYFKRQKIEGKWKAICNYCGSKLLGEAKQGTTHLRNHFKSCKLRTTRDIRQAFLKTEKKGSETNLVGCFAFNQELARSTLAKMIVAHEYPMAMVEHKFFKEFLSIVAPLFKGVTRNTIRSDIMKIYNEERENTMKLLSRNQGRIAITTDMWTSSNQNLGYMTVTSHFIERVKAICQDLVKEYDTRDKGKETISSTPSVNPSVENVGDDTMKEEWKTNFAKHMDKINKTKVTSKSELDSYLEEDVLPDKGEEFDILNWWKVNGLKYPTLQMVARDFLAIPISTVASESSFSTSGRFVTPHRSRLCADTLEAMMCLQNWIWNDVKGSSTSKPEDIEFCNSILANLDADSEPSEKSVVIDITNPDC